MEIVFLFGRLMLMVCIPPAVTKQSVTVQCSKDDGIDIVFRNTT